MWVSVGCYWGAGYGRETHEEAGYSLERPAPRELSITKNSRDELQSSNFVLFIIPPRAHGRLGW